MVDVALRPYSRSDRALLVRGNTPAMTQHLGGPETNAQITTRHNNYLRFWEDGSARMYVIAADAEPVGAIGWWSTEWTSAAVHEAGWFVLPEAQGHGIARAAVALVVDDAREHGKHPLLTAFPSVTNAASNALCRSSGFRLRGSETFPFRGVILEVNAWALDLHGSPDGVQQSDSHRTSD